VQRAKYEQTVLRELRKILLNPNKQPGRREEGGLADKIRVEEVRLETSELDHKVVILFRDLDRPQCLFGYEMEAIEWHEPGYDLRFLDPEIWTTIVWANFQERIVSQPLPEGCSPGEITRV
jgi:predicted esterase YcpF (UPF0227 family)